MPAAAPSSTAPAIHGWATSLQHGAWGYVVPPGQPSDSYVTDSPISGTSDPPLFQSERYWATPNTVYIHGYQFDVPNGVYRVDFGLAEKIHTQPGQRVSTSALKARRSARSILAAWSAPIRPSCAAHRSRQRWRPQYRLSAATRRGQDQHHLGIPLRSARPEPDGTSNRHAYVHDGYTDAITDSNTNQDVHGDIDAVLTYTPTTHRPSPRRPRTRRRRRIRPRPPTRRRRPTHRQTLDAHTGLCARVDSGATTGFVDSQGRLWSTGLHQRQLGLCRRRRLPPPGDQTR